MNSQISSPSAASKLNGKLPQHHLRFPLSTCSTWIRILARPRFCRSTRHTFFYIYLYHSFNLGYCHRRQHCLVTVHKYSSLITVHLHPLCHKSRVFRQFGTVGQLQLRQRNHPEALAPILPNSLRLLCKLTEYERR